MKKAFLYFISAVGLCIVSITACNSRKSIEDFHKPIIEVDFDQSMGKTTPEYQMIVENPEDNERLTIIRNMYEQNKPSNVQKASKAKIPKIIHQIWVGPNLPPPYFAQFKEIWRNIHPDWEYHLWTESQLADLKLELQDLIDQSPNYAEKADIIRAELLERFGGVYLDVDMDCMQSLNELNLKYDFYAGLEHPHKIATTKNMVWLGISIIAAAPHHPIIKRWKELIRERWDEVNRSYHAQVNRVINHTYFPFSMAFFEKYQDKKPNGEGYVNIVFPTTYFYPLSPIYASKRRSTLRMWREKIYDLFEKVHLAKPRPFSKIMPETIAVHYWGNSWLPDQRQQIKDLQQQVEYLSKELWYLQRKIVKIEKQTEPIRSES